MQYPLLPKNFFFFFEATTEPNQYGWCRDDLIHPLLIRKLQSSAIFANGSKILGVHSLWACWFIWRTWDICQGWWAWGAMLATLGCAFPEISCRWLLCHANSGFCPCSHRPSIMGFAKILTVHKSRVWSWESLESHFRPSCNAFKHLISITIACISTSPFEVFSM